MALEGITLGVWEFFAIVIGIPSIITVPLTAYLIRLKSKTEQHDKCIIRLENKIDSLAKQMEFLHRETKEDLREIKGFFIDWIQRVEDVTRDDDRFRSRRIKRKLPSDDVDPRDSKYW